MPHKPKFRVGDKFRLKIPRRVVRVGYPLDVKGAQLVLANDFWKVEAICAILQDRDIPKRYGPSPMKDLGPGFHNGAPNKLCRELGTAALYIMGFGGRVRSLHYEYDQEAFENRVFTVHRKRTVQTGEYFAPSGGYDSWNGEYWSEPGGLENKKHHVLLDAFQYETIFGETRLEFDQDDCEKVEDQ